MALLQQLIVSPLPRQLGRSLPAKDASTVSNAAIAAQKCLQQGEVQSVLIWTSGGPTCCDSDNADDFSIEWCLLQLVLLANQQVSIGLWVVARLLIQK